MIAPILASLSLPLALAFAASPLDRAATELVEKLELTGVPGFDVHADLAISVEAGAGSEGVARALQGLARARLEALGTRSIVAVEPGVDVEQNARDRGAEWLLSIKAETIGGEVLRLWAELRAIDRGLWVPPPKPGAATIYATAEHSMRIDPPLKELLAAKETKPDTIHRESKDELRFDGAPSRLLSVEDRVLAIAACEVAGPQARTVLLLLGTRTLFVFGSDRRRLASLDLTQLPRAPQPSREPLGTLACTKGELSFGTSALKTGHVAHLESQRSGELSVKLVRPIDGLPLGYLSGNRLVLGAIDLGRGRFASALRIEAAGKVQERDVGAPLLDVALDPTAPLGFRAIGVMVDHKLVRLGDELDSIQPVIASGVGVQIVADDKAACFVTTSKEHDEEHDKVALVAFDRGAARRIDAADVEGAVYATTIGSLGGEGRAVLIAAYHAPIGKTDVLSLKLSR